MKQQSQTSFSSHLSPAAFGRLCVETLTGKSPKVGLLPAAFGRLCVETLGMPINSAVLGIQPPSGGCVLKHCGRSRPVYWIAQPPSGGCVLKLITALWLMRCIRQPPSGGCVLKRCQYHYLLRFQCQPPSGGCVLKHVVQQLKIRAAYPAAFGRLCVETKTHSRPSVRPPQPPSGGCVLKQTTFRASLKVV